MTNRVTQTGSRACDRPGTRHLLEEDSAKQSCKESKKQTKEIRIRSNVEVVHAISPDHSDSEVIWTNLRARTAVGRLRRAASMKDVRQSTTYNAVDVDVVIKI